MPLTLVTWNINSIRLRASLVEAFMADEKPDVICFQETKSPVEKLPNAVFEGQGYHLITARGFKGYNGVAIYSRIGGTEAPHMEWVGKDDARHCAMELRDGTILHNFYVPAGGDVPDREKNDKFGHKLDFVAEMTAWSKGLKGKHIVVGDLNIAPLETDVWSHKQLLKVVSHTPVETEAMTALMAAGGWNDVTRTDIPEPEKLYSWWSYRSKDWEAANKGRRLDHIWTRGDVSHVTGSSRIAKKWRGEEKPSDHAPVFATLEI